MPQMSPMSWIMIYMYIIIVMATFMMKMYFNKNQTMMKKNKMTKKMNWKW